MFSYGNRENKKEQQQWIMMITIMVIIRLKDCGFSELCHCVHVFMQPSIMLSFYVKRGSECKKVTR